MPTTTTTHADPASAEAAYARRAARARAVLGCLDDALAAHATGAAARARDWGNVGDLAALEATLKQALAQLAGSDPAALDAALDAMDVVDTKD